MFTKLLEKLGSFLFTVAAMSLALFISSWAIRGTVHNLRKTVAEITGGVWISEYFAETASMGL